RGRRLVVVVLPAPVWPTIAIDSPALAWNDTSLKTHCLSSYANHTLRNSICPFAGLPGRMAFTGFTIAAGVSINRNRRSELAIAVCRMLYFSLISAMG